MKPILLTLTLLVFSVFLVSGQYPVKKDTGTFTDSRDSHTYKWVKIGKQVWMAENLAYLPIVGWPKFTSYSEKLYYVYGYENFDTVNAKKTNNYKIYGVLYNWPAATNGSASSFKNPSGVQGVCPTGWHLPSSLEWKELIAFLGDKSGVKMKAEGDEYWTRQLVGTNKSGFTALPGGWLTSRQKFEEIGFNAHFWSSGEMNESMVYIYYLDQYSDVLLRYEISKSYGISVRCIKNH